MITAGILPIRTERQYVLRLRLSLLADPISKRWINYANLPIRLLKNSAKFVKRLSGTSRR
jgi:hypothetical protein